MNRPASSTIAAWLRTPRAAGGAAVLAGSLFSLWLTGWFGLDRHEPLSFNGDHMLWLGYARAFVEGHGFRWSDSLGFPGMRDHMYHPTFYFSQKSIMWVTARLVDNPATVIAVFYGVGIVLMYGACYWALRRLSIGRAPATLGGVAFVVTPFFAFRAGLHDPLAVYYSVPLGAMLAFRVGLPDTVDAVRVSLRQRLTDPLSWALVLLVAVSGVYYAFFAAIFVAFAGMVGALAQRSIAPAAQAALLSAGIVVALLVTGPGLGLLDILNGAVAAPARQPMEQSLYGLSVGDAVKSLAHLPFSPTWWSAGVAGMGLEGTFGEWPGVLLTLVILASPIVALGAALTRSGTGSDGRAMLVALAAGCTAFGVLFTARGGLGLLFNQIVTASFRAQSRVIPFLTFFAIVVVLVWLQQARHARRRWLRAVVSVGLVGGLVSSVVESTPRFPLRTKQQLFLASEGQQANRRSIEDMLARLHETGARTVLQLPIVSWPEVASIRGFTPYHFELPHVLDRARSGVRWSYGTSTGQSAFTHLSTVVDTHRGRGLVGAARALGFDAIAIEKSPLDATELASWRAAIEAEMGTSCLIFDDARRALYLIDQPGRNLTCQGPVADLTTEPTRYVTAAGRFGRSLLHGGWSSGEATYTWTDGMRARLSVPVPPHAREADALQVTFDFGVYRPDAQKPKTIVFQVGGVDAHRVEIGPGEPPPTSVTLTIGAEHVRSNGTIDVVILLPDAESPAAYGSADPRQLGIALSEFRVRAAP